MRIDLTTALYGKLTGRPKATPRDVLNKRLQKVAGTPKQWIDADMALQDYIAHVGKAFSPSGGTLSPDGCVLTLKDNDTEGGEHRCPDGACKGHQREEHHRGPCR